MRPVGHPPGGRHPRPTTGRLGRGPLCHLWMLFALGCAGEALDPALVARVDHHIHLLSPTLIADWKSMGVPFSRPDSAYTSVAHLLRADSGLAQAVVASMAYLYGNQEFRDGLRLDEAAEAARVRQENDHVAAQAASHPGRLAGFCSVQPFRPYATAEIRRCRDSLSLPGLKLHLGQALADYADSTHLAILAGIAAWADSTHTALLLHLDPQRRGVEVADIRRFIDQVLAPHSGLQVIVAHFGGSGGLGPWTRDLAGAFADWLAGLGEGARPGVQFDLSAVLLRRDSEGVPATTPEELAMLAPLIGRLGISRIVFGSDYPVFDPFVYAAFVSERGGLTLAQLNAISRNRAPVLQRLGGGAAAEP